LATAVGAAVALPDGAGLPVEAGVLAASVGAVDSFESPQLARNPSTARSATPPTRPTALLGLVFALRMVVFPNFFLVP